MSDPNREAPPLSLHCNCRDGTVIVDHTDSGRPIYQPCPDCDGEMVVRDDSVTITHRGKVTIEAHASGRAKRNWPNSARERGDVDQYEIVWNDAPEHVPDGYDELVHGRSIGCPDCRMNTRAVFRGFPEDPHYECLVCGYRNEFDPSELSSMRRSSFGEVIDHEA